jgi:hypothetical protein
MGKREMSAFAAESRGKVRRLAVKLQFRTLSGKPDDLNILPGHAVAQPGSDGLHSGLLGGEAGGQALRGVGLGHAVSQLGGSENALEKTLTKALYGSLNPLHFSDVNPSPYNHLALYAKVSYGRVPASKTGLIY